jgi:ribosomal protein S18 acetylase RimI-like enzyme
VPGQRIERLNDMTEPRIRPYEPADLDAVYEVCLRTGDAGNDASHLLDDPVILGHLYVGPYVTLEPSLAFVLEDARGVCGYVLGALESDSFYRRYRDEWLPTLQARYSEPQGDASTWSRTERLYHQVHHPRTDFPPELRDYPSHLHIDLLPRAQGRGNGQRMMARLLSALREHGSDGVWLGVNPSNNRAIAFYEKLGFREVVPAADTASDALFMSMPLGRTQRPPGPPRA